jgi:hypothetical protein
MRFEVRRSRLLIALEARGRVNHHHAGALIARSAPWGDPLPGGLLAGRPLSVDPSVQDLIPTASSDLVSVAFSQSSHFQGRFFSYRGHCRLRGGSGAPTPCVLSPSAVTVTTRRRVHSLPGGCALAARQAFFPEFSSERMPPSLPADCGPRSRINLRRSSSTTSATNEVDSVFAEGGVSARHGGGVGQKLEGACCMDG